MVALPADIGYIHSHIAGKSKNNGIFRQEGLMNVLIVSEQFSKGGLETHILKQVAALSDSINFVFAFSKFEEVEELAGAKVCLINSFFSGYSVKDFIEQVDALVKIIKDEEIEVIHAHPFLSLLPALFASVLTNKPIVYTIHGAGSLSADYGSYTFSFLKEYFFSEMNPQVIVVRKDFNHVITSDYGVKNLTHIPNTALFAEDWNENSTTENRWAYLGRLDADNKPALFEIINNLDNLDIQSLDIYGAGTCQDETQSLIIKNELTDRVALKGWLYNIGKLREQNYEGLIGHGQAALEGLSMGLPVLLSSYGRISGLLDLELYQKVKDCNFVNIYLPNVDIEIIAKQIKELRQRPQGLLLRDLVRKDFDNNEVQKKYAEVLHDAKYHHSLALVDLWRSINNAVMEHESLLSEAFLYSEIIENLLKESFLKFWLTITPQLLQLNVLKESQDVIKHSHREVSRLSEIIAQQNERLIQQNEQIEHLLSFRGSVKSVWGAVKRRTPEFSDLRIREK